MTPRDETDIVTTYATELYDLARELDEHGRGSSADCIRDALDEIERLRGQEQGARVSDRIAQDVRWLAGRVQLKPDTTSLTESDLPRSVDEILYRAADVCDREVTRLRAHPESQGERYEGWIPRKGEPKESVPFFGHVDYTTGIREGVRRAILLLPND